MNLADVVGNLRPSRVKDVLELSIKHFGPSREQMDVVMRRFFHERELYEDSHPRYSINNEYVAGYLRRRDDQAYEKVREWITSVSQ